MAYDQKCYDLAESFLEDEKPPVTEDEKKDLAQRIQTTIEDFFLELEEGKRITQELKL